MNQTLGCCQTEQPNLADDLPVLSIFTVLCVNLKASLQPVFCYNNHNVFLMFFCYVLWIIFVSMNNHEAVTGLMDNFLKLVDKLPCNGTILTL